MRNTQESGQILRSKKRPRRTLRIGRGSRTNSNTSRQIPARVIDADSPSAVVYGGADMPLIGPIPEGGTFFCPHCGAKAERARNTPTRAREGVTRKQHLLKLVPVFAEIRPCVCGKKPRSCRFR